MHMLCYPFSLLVHSSQVKTSVQEEVKSKKSKLLAEDDAYYCKPVKFTYTVLDSSIQLIKFL